jgi:hypothetical protein
MRWIGMAIVAVAVMLGTPVAVSFLPHVSLKCPAPMSMPVGRRGEDWRSLSRGAIVQDRLVYPEHVFSMTRFGREDGGPFSFRWERAPDRSVICLPVWPVPIALALAGALVWWWGTRRLIRRSKQKVRPIRITPWRARATGIALGLLGLSACSLIAVSHMCRGGVSVFKMGDGVNGSMLNWGVVRGAGFSEHDPAWQPAPYSGPKRGPFSIWWKVDGKAWSVCVPVWPIAVLLLGVGIVVISRNERALLRVLRGCCDHCGYSLSGLPAGVCPECGRSP